ncbi:hypothetical protein DRO24_00825 [Candidatus Bathyarchaeota archaeon]|nr:MAG: hypothetical protein DRO24_00825 [Candidatus Bathyarchaeota archaeon]
MSSRQVEVEVSLIERVYQRRKEILAEAEREAKRIRRAAEEEAKRIKGEAEKAAKLIIDRRLRAARERILGEAEMEGRRKLMEAREEMVSRVFEEATKRIENLINDEERRDEYLEILSKLIAEAVERIGGSEFIISANERDLELLKRNLGKIRRSLPSRELKLTLSEEPIECLGGVIVESGDRLKVYNNTLDGRLLRVRRLLSAKVAERLGVIG